MIKKYKLHEQIKKMSIINYILETLIGNNINTETIQEVTFLNVIQIECYPRQLKIKKKMKTSGHTCNTLYSPEPLLAACD